jgi:flagellin-like hook-associated protein FlgL
MVQSLVQMRARLDDLQRQLGTGKKSETYAGVGLDRGLAVALRGRVSAVESFTDTIATVGVRLELAQTALGRIDELSRTVRTETRFTPYELDNTGQTMGQKNARFQLDELLGLLSTQAGDRYLFSGRAGDQPPVESLSNILDGDGVRAGLKQVTAERNQADLGTGLGRLVIPPAAGSVVSMNEDVAGSVFGFKLAAIASGLTNATTAGPAGAPPAVSVDLTGGNPNEGETITFSLTLPDGSSENVVLTATTDTTPGPNEFTIGGTTAVTATNLQAALTTAVGKLARTSLAAASAVAAANDFFNIDDANPPQRVAGPPFATATALTAGTPANTVFWYTGDGGDGTPGDTARSTAVAQIDQSLTIPYGLRANEDAIRVSVRSIAAYAVMTFSPTDVDGEERFQALSSRVGSALSNAPGQQRINDIEADLATAQATLGATKERHQQSRMVLMGLVDGIEGVPIEEVGAQVLALNTRLQASLQTTSMLFQTSLVNYL